jgi:hypothetical protein
MERTNSYKQQITPNRFIAHVSCSSNRTEILSNGILASKALNNISESYGVFAHDSMTPTEDWYPFTLERWESINGLNYSLLDKYDYWVIDTHRIKNIWFNDDIATKDFGHPNLYIMTKENIPSTAIKLYKFQQELFWEKKGIGAVHFCSKPRFRQLSNH